MATTAFSIVTPEALRFEGPAEIVIVPGSEGELGALPRHAALVTTLKPGIVRANALGSDGKTTERREFAIGPGFAQILPDSVTVLVDAAWEKSEVDIDATRAELRSLREHPSGSEGEAETARLAEQILVAKLRVAGGHE
ncbi:MAG TPA: ATP synthase F1 subunit epsilon [Candidatus Dormibacteraeota bacterium]|nr:ATP synthase F1 subunit epsilon [Candidatus Dormibacteraeota bacterium]